MSFRDLLRPRADTPVERACLFFVGDVIIIQRDNLEYLSYYKIEDADSVEQVKSTLEAALFVPDNGQVPRSGDMFVHGSINCVRA